MKSRSELSPHLDELVCPGEGFLVLRVNVEQGTWYVPRLLREVGCWPGRGTYEKFIGNVKKIK
jgi:hypothetical protein